QKSQRAEYDVADHTAAPTRGRYALNESRLRRHEASPKTVNEGEREARDLPPARSGRVPVPDRLAVGSDDLFPAVFENRDGALRHRDIVERFRHLGAVLVGPIKEGENLFGPAGVLLFLVHQDERRTGNRPGLLTRLVGEDQIKAGRAPPIRVGGG